MLALLLLIAAHAADMVPIPAGPFTMGCTGDLPACDDNATPPHTVTLSAYSLDRTPVTQADYSACVSAGACTTPLERFAFRPDDHPRSAVVGVSWFQADAYCRWRDARLPTEAEWARAARGPDARPFPWGSQPPTCEHAHCGMATHVDVGERPRGASAEGVLDLMGTVKEWTADWYSVDAFARGDAADPGGPATGTQRVLRGLQGGFLDGVYGARRMGWSPGRTQTEVGFRCATGRAPIPDPLPHSSEVAWKVRDVAVGEVHTCAVNPQGAAWCWGNNRFGQLGDPEAARSARPVRVGLDGVQAIAAGPLTACASTSDRTVCWGELAEDSALGFDEVTPWEGPAAESLTLDSHVCLTLGPARILACAGANQDSQLGRGTVAGAYAPNEPLLPVGQLEGVVTAAAGGSHTCAVDGDGALWCWGDNGTGQLGLEGDAPRAAPTRVSWEELYALQAPIAELVAGSQHTCARLTDGTVRCWGRGSYGALGRTWPARDDGSLGPLTMGKPVPVEQIDDATALAAGYDHTCAIRRDKTLWCWGDNSGGQLGDGTLVSRASPAQVPDLKGVLAVSAGRHNTCAVTREGLWCWGDNDEGQLGDGSHLSRSAPIRVPPP